MIRIQCDECSKEFEITNIRYFGISEVTVLAKSCDCERTITDEVFALEETNEELHGDIELLEERLEEITDAYDKLEMESKDLKWKKKFITRTEEYDELRLFADNLTYDLKEARLVHEKTIRTNIEVLDRRRSENNIKYDDLEMKYAELKIKHKKMVFKYDKIRAKANGGNYERSVDL